MMSTVLGIVAVFASIQSGWMNFGAGNDVRGVRSVELVIDVTVSNSTGSGICSLRASQMPVLMHTGTIDRKWSNQFELLRMLVRKPVSS